MKHGLRATLAAALLAALSTTASFAADPIKVGILITTTGPYAPWGKDYQQGIGLYLDQHSGKDGRASATTGPGRARVCRRSGKTGRSAAHSS